MIKSKDEKVYVCRSCRNQIKSGKEPKKADKILNQKFPIFLKSYLKKKVNYMEAFKKRNPQKEQIIRNSEIDQILQLNKLEAHILKLVLPFIRIAHCPRGRYMKVKGSIIFISSDVSHSLSKILPIKQNLLPVCLKRKLEYTGNYLEEIIDKNKVEVYFEFFKKFNPLFNDIQFNNEQIENYENECRKTAREFEEALENITERTCKKRSDSETESDSVDEWIYESGDEDWDDTANVAPNTEHEEKFDDVNYFRDHSTVFCNKYEQDMHVETVANRLATIICGVETEYKITRKFCQPIMRNWRKQLTI